ncbi:dipeptide transport system ATP-binding protein [Andreprevotia lacus DSM 23236]|jgi:dipeptide transport system ATP-binding protein|uniref:Dipeptide transport system ATP-binding protein n=1 Tax=Andreprevotia lacus DSM 23236 TaxID=1121001 RepID=A0A1W1XRR1_9NEIS|nr:oligopeptide/dipeptide ABC transporter ATP-binding protein [Andreprevotia lacus]SMC26554.1 dipeptide transport system ATP-binding protein [Andreprevotia lacus DSM 23236]
MSLLQIENLSVQFGAFRAVNNVSLTVNRGEILGIVGESGSGKSVSMLALMGLIDAPGVVTADALQFDGQDLLHARPAQKRKLIGKDVAMIFQDALSSLNPAFTIGAQLVETLKLHLGLSGAAARNRALELLELVEIPDARARLAAYPHQLSGGMSQRVMIAMAIACNPKLLIADEPTTALDVTVQAQIMDLLVSLQKQHDMGLILITHDLAVVAEVAQRVAVMYAGEVVETSPVPDIFSTPRHPYTQALLASIPEHSKGASRLATLPGVVPGQYDRPAGCLLSPRCPYVQPRCHTEHPPLQATPQGTARCFYALNDAGSPTHG